MTGRPHRKTCRLRRQQPAKKRTQAARSGRPHRLLCAPLCSGWTPELVAAWPLSRHSVYQNGPRQPISPHALQLCGLAAFRAAGSCACIRLRGLPGSTSSPPRPLRSFRRKPRHTKISCVESQAADSNRPGCRRYAPHRGHFRRGLFNPGAFFGGVPHAARADRCGCAPSKPPGLVLAGVALLRGQVSGVHSARIRHATARTPCHAGCYALRSPFPHADIFRPEAPDLVGASDRKMFFSDSDCTYFGGVILLSHDISYSLLRSRSLTRKQLLCGDEPQLQIRTRAAGRPHGAPPRKPILSVTP